jgi:hypothetical protein
MAGAGLLGRLPPGDQVCCAFDHLCCEFDRRLFDRRPFGSLDLGRITASRPGPVSRGTAMTGLPAVNGAGPVPQPLASETAA